MATIDDKDKKIGEVPHLQELKGDEKIPVSAEGEPRYVEIQQILDAGKGEETTPVTTTQIDTLFKQGQ